MFSMSVTWDVSQVMIMVHAFVDSGLQSCPSWAVGTNAGGPC